LADGDLLVFLRQLRVIRREIRLRVIELFHIDAHGNERSDGTGNDESADESHAHGFLCAAILMPPPIMIAEKASDLIQGKA
jgi:hypothetical protein